MQFYTDSSVAAELQQVAKHYGVSTNALLNILVRTTLKGSGDAFFSVVKAAKGGDSHAGRS